MQFLIILHKAMMVKSELRVLKRIRVGRSSPHQMNARCVVTESKKERGREMDEDKFLKEGMRREIERGRFWVWWCCISNIKRRGEVREGQRSRKEGHIMLLLL